jgi:hypothetical protein
MFHEEHVRGSRCRLQLYIECLCCIPLDRLCFAHAGGEGVGVAGAEYDHCHQVKIQSFMKELLTRCKCRVQILCY